MIPTDKAQRQQWLVGVELADQMLDEAYEEDRYMLMAARAGEMHDNIVRRYMAQAQQEGDMVLEGFTATLSDVIASSTRLGSYRREAVKATYWALRPNRVEAEA